MKQIFMKKLMVIMLSLPLLGTVATADCTEKENKQQANAERRKAVAHFKKVFDRQEARKREERKKLPAIAPKAFAAWAQGVNEELALKKQQPNASSNAQPVHSNDGALEQWEQEFQKQQQKYSNVQDMPHVPLARQLTPLTDPKRVFEELSANVTKRRKTKNAQVLVNPAQESLNQAVDAEADAMVKAALEAARK